MAAWRHTIVMAWHGRHRWRRGLDSTRSTIYFSIICISALARVGLAVWRSIIGIGIDYRSISHDVKQRKNDGVAINIFQGGKLCA